tara:strand:- start:1729 stop:1962 length:234 start_codon:yes stop_codon:yes gene_type:complete
MPEYEEPKVAPAAPRPIQPDSMGSLPPPMSTSAGQGDEAKLKKRTTTKKDLQRTSGINRFKIPLNTGKNKTTLNIPK